MFREILMHFSKTDTCAVDLYMVLRAKKKNPNRFGTNHAGIMTQKVLTWASKNNVEVHAVDTNTRVILDAQINVFLNTKSKVASVREIVLPQLVLTHLLER